MNRRVRLVLADYVGRTGHLWLLVALAQVIQSVTFRAIGVPRVPLLGLVLARVTYTALAEKPWGVLRTLPLTTRDAALIRWWGSFGLPALGVTSCMALAELLCEYKHWVLPDPLWLGTCTVTVIAVLAWLSAFEKVLSYPRAVTLVWGALAIVALIGLPVRVLSTPVLLLIGCGGLGLSIIASLPARNTRAISTSDPLLPRYNLKPRGWSILFVETGRTTATIAVAALIATTVVHRTIAPWARTGLQGTVIWLVISAIAVTTTLSIRRWVEAVRSLRILPITGPRLALVLYLATIMPGVLTCLLVSTVHYLAPDWGLDIPWYLLVVFLPAPVTLIRWHRPAENDSHYLPQQWTSALQQAIWPAWAGAFCALSGGFQFMPTWFFLDMALIAALFSVAGYRAILGGIRSPTTFA